MPASPASDLHPRHGVHDPTASTPARRPGSLRRTSTVDALRPDGPGGDLILRGRARDLQTGADGSARTLGEAELEARVRYPDKKQLDALSTRPEEPLASRLLGTPVGSGFRAVLDEALPAQREARSLLYLLLDELPVATLVSGFALQKVAGGNAPVPVEHIRGRADICSGWKSDGTIFTEVAESGRLPVLTGPVAPSLARDGDPQAWHDFGPLPPHSMRRHRRLDLWREGGDLVLDVLFRDSYFPVDGPELCVHEYTLDGRVDPASLEIREVVASPRALPWVDCSQAVASAADLTGRHVSGLRPGVRADFVGPGTCTHLNDTFRSLEDIEVLAERLG